MNEATFLGLFVAGLGLSLGLLVWLTGPRLAGWSQGRTLVTAFLFGAGGLVFGGYAYWIENRIARVTLHEAVVEGSMNLKAGDDAPVRKVEFQVENPGVEHGLSIYPRIGSFNSASIDAEAIVSLADPEGQTVLQKILAFGLEEGGSRTVSRMVWESREIAFTPTVDGTYRLTLVPTVAGIPEFFIRITDPTKTNGVRDASLRP